jgi:hypothetical protein
MTCEDYLSMLETLAVDELGYGEARDHVAQCYDCNRVTRVVAARERNMTLAYAEAYPSASAVTVAERAIEASRRRRVAFYVRTALGAAAVVTLLATIMTRRVVPAPSRAVVEKGTFNLQCLSPQQAVELLREEIPNAPGLLISALRPPVTSARLGVLHIEGSPVDVQAVRSVLDRYDTPAQSQCGVERSLPKR